MGFRLTGNRSSFEPQTEELLHLCPLSRSSGRRVVRRPEISFQNSRAIEWLLSCVQDLCSGKIRLLQQTQKTQIAFGLAGGLSKPD